MSHEIRTPMNGVVGMAELLATPLTEEQRLYANTIRGSGEALLVIINDVLDYSKIEADKLVLHPEPFDLERSIHEVVMLLQPTARDKGLTLLVDYDLFLPTHFVGDPGRMRQVLTNLIGNAVKFTAEGACADPGDGVPDEAGDACAVHISVEDTGIGIPPDKIDHVFGEFNQVEDERNRKFEGTGLGLAITRRLIELMGGSVWVETDADPVRPPTLPDGVRNVLVVDDLRVNRAILEKQMTQLGMQVTCCASGAEAIETMNADIDVVLTDHNMPDMDGLELAEALKTGDWPDVPILLLSSNPGYAQNDPALRYLTATLQKPVRRAALLDHLARLGPADLPEALPLAVGAEDPPTARAIPAKPATGAPPPVAVPTAQGGDAPDAATEAEPAMEAPTEDGSPGARRMRVLAAEDNKTNRLVFKKMVKDLDIDLRFAENGREAIELHESFEPDLIFMDISMPEVDGKEATRTIRAREAETGAHVTIVALTAHAMGGDAEEILAAGLDHYMTKPLRKGAIHERILEHCPPDAHPPVCP
jgi:CheY-like chemotaxis protein